MSALNPALQGRSSDLPIKYNVWWRTNRSPADPPSLHRWRWWKDEDFSRLTLEELVQGVKGEEITHLMFDNVPTSFQSRSTVVPADLPEEIKHSLQHLTMRGVYKTYELRIVVSCLSNIGSLESLCLYEMNLRSVPVEIRDILMRLKLKHLTMSDCNLTSDILSGISLMSTLEDLDLSINNLSRNGSLSEKFSTLTSLKRLDLSECQLTEIPQSLQGMVYLMKLNVAYNQIEFIPEWIGSLISLRELKLSGNESLRKLHRNINSLPLTELNLEDCDNLSEPPKYVCEGGVENIRRYLTELDKDSAPDSF